MTGLSFGQEVLHRMGVLHPLVLGEPDRLRGDTPAWTSHIPFAFWLVLALRPRRFVELGTHTGVSYSAFCQAIRALELETQAFAVDTWQGDEHAGYYGDVIFEDVSRFTTERYSAFSHLLRMTFDDAVSRFEDGSIDLLHIDGLHTYDAVKHDFDSWRAKLTPDAIVLFHDTQVRERGFEVWRLFEELAAEFSSFEFRHGHGLGVICLSRDVPAPLDLLLQPPGQRLPPETDDAVQTFFSTLGNNWTQRGLSEVRLQEKILELQTQIQNPRSGLGRAASEGRGLLAPLRKKFRFGGAFSRG